METVPEQFEKWLKTVPEHPVWTRSQIKALVALDERMLNILEPRGLGYDGFSWRPGTPYGTLCLKTSNPSGTYVTFVTERGLSICVGILLKHIREDRLVLKRDRFRPN